ncbi:MAG: cytochrome c oxidase subunit II [Elusimicrobiota bacterium]
MSQHFPIDISTTGYLIDNLFWLATYLIAVAFTLVLIALFYFLIRYRSRPSHKAYYTHGTSRQALFVTLGLALAVFLLIDVNLAYHDHKAWEKIWQPTNKHNAEVLKIQVMPEQYAWNVRYSGVDGIFNTPDDVVTINELHIPINHPIIVQLKSKDVIHSFFLPNMRIKQDAVPGLITSLTFEATKTGEYDIACAEHCGLGHYRMRGLLTVESEENFALWLSAKLAEKDSDPLWGWDWRI